jgi:hypothetical protein
MVKRKLWKFNRTNPTEDAKPKLPLTLEITEIEHSLARIAAKANNVLSSPIRKTMDSVRRDAPALFWEDKRHRIQSEILYRRVSEMITKKPHGRISRTSFSVMQLSVVIILYPYLKSLRI